MKSITLLAGRRCRDAVKLRLRGKWLRIFGLLRRPWEGRQPGVRSPGFSRSGPPSAVAPSWRFGELRKGGTTNALRVVNGAVSSARSAFLVPLSLIPFFVGAFATSAQDPPSERTALAVNVSEGGTRKALPGTVVSVRLGTATNSVRIAETDASGQCMVEWPKDWKDEIRVRVEKPGFAPIQKEWLGPAEEDAPPNEFAFSLWPSQRLGGRVLDQSDQPIENARIVLSFPQRLTAPRVPLSEFPIFTDADGRWITDLVPAGTSTLKVTAAHPSCVVPNGSEGAQPSLESLMDQSAVIRLERTLILAGRVLDPDGQPVENAKVVHGSEWGIMGLEENQAARTGTDGKFEFSRIIAGRYLIAAQAEGFGPATVTTEIKPDSAPAELTLTKPEVLQGRVVDLDGNAIEGVRVAANEWERFRYPGWETKTDADGRFRLQDMPRGVVAFDFTKGGYMGRLMHRVTTGEGDQIVKLGPVLRLRGRVLDAETKNPIAEFSITPGWPRQIIRQGKLVNSGGEWANYSSKKMRNGSYDMTFDRPIVMGAPEIYDFLLRVDAEGYDPAVSRAFKPDEREAEFDFLLNKGAGLKGVVHMPDGSPVRNTKIYAYSGFNGPFIRNGRVLSASRSTEYLTGQDGSFTMPKPLEEMDLLVLGEDGYAQSNTSKLEGGGVITLKRWARIRGVLKVGRRFGVNEKVAVRFPSRYETERGGMRQIAPVFRDSQATTDDQGRFEFDRLPAGDLGLVRVIDLPRPQGMGIAVGDVWGGCPLKTVRVKSGETVTVEMGGDGRVVTGRLLLPDGVSQPVDWSNGRFLIGYAGPKIELPEDVSSEHLQSWLDQRVWSDAESSRRRWLGGTPQVLETGMIVANMTSWFVAVGEDGSLRIQDLPPGNYTVNGWLNGPPISRGNFQQPGPAIARVQHSFWVPDPSPGGDETPVELGEIQMAVPPEMPQSLPGVAPRTPAKGPGDSIDVAAPALNERLTARMISNPAEARAGETVELLVKVRILPGFLIGGLSDGLESDPATKLDLELPEQLTAEGKWTVRQPSGPSDQSPVLQWYRDIVFGRSVKISSETSSGPLRLRCQLKAQVRNQIVNWPAVTIPLETAIEVVK